MLADCIVVGGGIVGAAAAWRLQQRGLRVLLLDRQQPGLEASFAGAGMLSPGGEDLGDGYWLDAALESRRMYAAFVTELVGASGLAIDYQDCGALEWILPEAETRLQRLRTRGVFMEDRSEAGQHKLWFPGDGSVEPRDVMAALRKLLASCTLQEEVKTINPGRIVRVNGHEAKLVVLAAGAWTQQLQVAGCSAAPNVFPVRGHMLGYQLSPGELPHILRRGHTYLLQRRNGFLLAGSTMEHVGFDRAIDATQVEAIRLDAEALLPALCGRQPDLVWNGLRPGVEGGLPLLKQAAENVWLATGHFRNGILLAPFTAERIVDAALGLRPRAAAAIPPSVA
jgi:glycine oxidase